MARKYLGSHCTRYSSCLTLLTYRTRSSGLLFALCVILICNFTQCHCVCSFEKSFGLDLIPSLFVKSVGRLDTLMLPHLCHLWRRYIALSLLFDNFKKQYLLVPISCISYFIWILLCLKDGVHSPCVEEIGPVVFLLYFCMWLTQDPSKKAAVRYSQPEAPIAITAVLPKATKPAASSNRQQCFKSTTPTLHHFKSKPAGATQRKLTWRIA